MMDLDAKKRELEELHERIRQIEAELVEEGSRTRWRARDYYTAYYATTGFLLGMFAAAASLLFNIVGALLFGKYPLELIRVYLTFPLGEQALKIDSGIALAIGCCLYLATGMLLGVPYQLALTRFAPRSFTSRFVLVTAMSLALWLVNFYGILSWLQPLLIGGAWIVEQIPWWVAALTHLVFGWTMLLLYPLGLYVPYELPSERA